MTVTTASANTRSPRVNRSGIAGDYLVVIGEPRRPAALVLERGTAALGTLKAVRVAGRSLWHRLRLRPLCARSDVARLRQLWSRLRLRRQGAGDGRRGVPR
jgi:hypothetical protein